MIAEIPTYSLVDIRVEKIRLVRICANKISIKPNVLTFAAAVRAKPKNHPFEAKAPKSPPIIEIRHNLNVCIYSYRLKKYIHIQRLIA